MRLQGLAAVAVVVGVLSMLAVLGEASTPTIFIANQQVRVLVSRNIDHVGALNVRKSGLIQGGRSTDFLWRLLACSAQSVTIRVPAFF